MCQDCDKQTDSDNCGVFASYYTREASQGMEIGGKAPLPSVFRAEMLTKMMSL